MRQFGQTRAAQWGILVLASMLGGVLFSLSRSPVGELQVVRFTLLPSDRDRLRCGMGRTVDGYACPATFDDRTVSVPTDRELVPVVSTAREVLLVAGLFAMPEVWGRLEGDVEQRFTVECLAKVIGVRFARVSFSNPVAFDAPTRRVVVRPRRCQVKR